MDSTPNFGCGLDLGLHCKKPYCSCTRICVGLLGLSHLVIYCVLFKISCSFIVYKEVEIRSMISNISLKLGVFRCFILRCTGRCRRCTHGHLCSRCYLRLLSYNTVGGQFPLKLFTVSGSDKWMGSYRISLKVPPFLYVVIIRLTHNGWLPYSLQVQFFMRD